ncbi:MAG: hypothetical protein ACKVH5_01800 [Fidelibacterota bacterium]
MPDSPFRSALLSKNRQACKEALSQDLRGTELVECLNDLLYCSVSVIQTSIQEMHPVCVINSIKNLIGDDRENPSKPLLQFAANYLLGFKFRNDDESILEDAARDGIGLTGFLGDLEDVCQLGKWDEVQAISAKIFLASDRSRGVMDSLAEIGLQDSNSNVLFIFHLLRAYQFQESKDDNWSFTKCMIDWLNGKILPEPHEQTEKTPRYIIDLMIENRDPTLFASVLRLWDGDYVRIRGFKRELSYWCSQILITDSEVKPDENHWLLNKDKRKFILASEKMVRRKKSKSEKANALVILEAVRALSSTATHHQLCILGARLNQLLS